MTRPFAWNAKTGECIKTLEGHERRVNSIMLIENGKKVISASDDTTVRLWNVETGECESVKSIIFQNATYFSEFQQVWSIGINSDDDVVPIIKGEEKDRVWLWCGGLEIHGVLCNCKIDCVAFAYGFAKWKRKWREKKRPDLDKKRKILVSGSDDKVVRVWNVETKTCAMELKGHDAGINSVAISYGGLKLASGSADKTVRVWNLATGECTNIFEGHTSSVSSVSFIPNNGNIISASFDSSLRVWNCKAVGCAKMIKLQVPSPKVKKKKTKRKWRKESARSLADRAIVSVSFSADRKVWYPFLQTRRFACGRSIRANVSGQAKAGRHLRSAQSK